MVAQGFVESEGGRIYFEVEGDGPALTLVHAGVANLRQWDPQIPEFARRHTVVRYDTRGFGRTQTENMSFSNRADLVAVLDHLGIERTHLLGTSRGGSIALDATLEFPERIASLIVVAGGISGFDSPSTSEDTAVFEELESRWEAKDWAALTDGETALWVDGPGQPPDRVDPVVRRTVHDWIAASYRDHADEEPEPRVLDPPANERLDEVRVPTLVIVGSLDTSGTIASSRRIAEGVADARLEVIEGVAHMVNLEQPDRFTALVLDFLAGVESSAVSPGS
jgi:pimeloyl-ACP methyl ester carboxylesterase